MRVAICNQSGSVGKSTLAHHILKPRLPDSEVLLVESINHSDLEDIEGVVKLTSTYDFRELIARLSTEPRLIADIGASNYEGFMQHLEDEDVELGELFDLILVPTPPHRKQMVDSIQTIQRLNQLGMPADRIKLVFMMVETRKGEAVLSGLDEKAWGRFERDLRKDFQFIFEAHVRLQNFVLNTRAALPDHPIYGSLSTLGVKEMYYTSKDDLRKLARGLRGQGYSSVSQSAMDRLGLLRAMNKAVQAQDELFENLMDGLVPAEEVAS